MLPLKIIIDIPIIIFYIAKLQRLNLDSEESPLNMQTSIHLDFVKKDLDLQLRSMKLRSRFLDKFEGNWVWEVRG